MFDFLKKINRKEESKALIKLYAPASGRLLPITEVADPVFANKMMGDGYAIEPEKGEIYAPVSGRVQTIFKTKHAIGLVTANGAEILLHIGIDTVELDGQPFTLYVKEGDYVQAGDSLATVDLPALDAAYKGKAVMVLLTNMNELTGFHLTEKGICEGGQQVGSVEKY